MVGKVLFQSCKKSAITYKVLQNVPDILVDTWEKEKDTNKEKGQHIWMWVRIFEPGWWWLCGIGQSDYFFLCKWNFHFCFVVIVAVFVLFALLLQRRDDVKERPADASTRLQSERCVLSVLYRWLQLADLTTHSKMTPEAAEPKLRTGVNPLQ